MSKFGKLVKLVVKAWYYKDNPKLRHIWLRLQYIWKEVCELLKELNRIVKEIRGSE